MNSHSVLRLDNPVKRKKACPEPWIIRNAASRIVVCRPPDQAVELSARLGAINDRSQIR